MAAGSAQIPKKMTGAMLPGNSSVEMGYFDVPEPGHGEVLLRVKSSTICGSDIRAAGASVWATASSSTTSRAAVCATTAGGAT